MRCFSLVLVAAMVGGVVPGRIFGQAATTAPKPANTAKAPAAMPTDREIAKAKAKGMVWGTKNGEVYQKDDPEYGKTKNGKFMTEADAWKEAKKTYDKDKEYQKNTEYHKDRESDKAKASEKFPPPLDQTPTPDDGQKNTHPETIKAPTARKSTKPSVDASPQ